MSDYSLAQLRADLEKGEEKDPDFRKEVQSRPLVVELWDYARGLFPAPCIFAHTIDALISWYRREKGIENAGQLSVAAAVEILKRHFRPSSAQGDEAEMQPTEATAKSTDAPAVELTDKEVCVLKALDKLKADGPRRRQLTARIARTVEGNNNSTASYKRPIANLKKLGLVETKESRQGGVWLTKKGQERLARLNG